MPRYAKGYIEKVSKDGGIQGAVASTGAIDRDEEIIDPMGWEYANFMTNPVLLWSHETHSLPIGKVTKVYMEGDQMKFNAIFAKQESTFAAEVAKLYEGGFINGVSVGFIPKERQGNKIMRQELLEISLVNVPANPEAGLSREYKSFEDKVKELDTKGAVPFHSEPLAPKDEAWDGPAQMMACGDDTMKMKAICAWFDVEHPDMKSSYKLPHHDAGNMHTVWRGVVAAMGALLGARGGVNIPEADRKAVYNHLAKHYEEFGEQAPDFKSADSEEPAPEKKVEVAEDVRLVVSHAIASLEQLLPTLRELQKSIIPQGKKTRKVEPVSLPKKHRATELLKALRIIDKSVEIAIRKCH